MADISSQNKFLGPKPPLPAKPGVLPVVPNSSSHLSTAEAEIKIPVKKSIPRSPAMAVSENEAIIIRTMKDDLGKVGQTPPQPTTGTKFFPDVTVKSPNASQSFPLPAKVGGGKSVIMPTTPKKTRHPLRMALFAIISLIVVAVGGVGVWYILTGNKEPAVSETVVTNPEELLPLNAVSITEYKFETLEKRQSITDLWAQQSTSQPSLSRLLEGDPRLVMNDNELTDLFYVNIPQETRPYILVRKTAQTQSIFGQPTLGVAIERNGWYIAHQVSTDSYISSLQSGVIAGSNKIQTFPDSYAIRIYVGSDGMKSLVESVGKSQFTSEIFKEATLISTAVTKQDISFKGVALRDVPNTTSITPLDSALLSLLPPQIQFLHAGFDFASDTSKYLPQGKPEVDNLIIAEPSVKQLLSQLTSQYLYYNRQNGGGSDLGLVIHLPAELSKTLKIGDPTLEKALFSLTPLIAAGKKASALTFNDGTYEDIPLRYVNVGSQTQAIDYTIHNDYLLVSSSKDGMFALLQNIKTPTVTTNAVIQTTAALEQERISQTITANTLNESDLKYILPGMETVPVGALGIKTLEGGTDSIQLKVTFPASL